MSKVYLVSAKRSAIGSMLGSLKDATPTWIGAQVLKAVIEDLTNYAIPRLFHDEKGSD